MGRKVLREGSGELGTPAALLRSAPRVASVLDVLRRHGFADVLVGGHRWPSPAQATDALEELGLVFVKFGQLLSTRRDVLPDPYADALERLQDAVAPLEPAAVREAVRQELGDDPEALFAGFEWTPLASASIAQVHAATLADGREVVVKVQRPGLDDRLGEDVLVLAQLAAVADVAVPRLRPYDLPTLVKEFRQSLEAELDFTLEARNIRRFRAQLGADDRVWIPAVIERLSTARVLTLERSHGVRVERYAAQHPEDARLLARRLGGVFIRQVFGDGLFHADPHPGNVFVLEGGVLCLHDFGMVSEVPEPMREALVDLVNATVAGDVRAATNAYLDLGLLPPNVERGELETEVGKLVAEVRGKPLAEVSVGRALESLARLGGRHRIRSPGAFMLLARAFVTLEGVLARLDPDVSFVEMFGTAFRETIGRRLAPDRLRRDALTALRALDKLAREAPDDVRRVLRRWSDGTLGRVTVAADQVEADRRDRSARRLRQSVVGGFLTVAGAILATGTSGWQPLVGLAFLGVGVSAVAHSVLRA